MRLDTIIPIRFLQTAFQANDFIAIAFRKLPAGAWEHRFLRIQSACGDSFQRFLRYLNSDGYDLYVSMNSFQPGRRSRTEANIAAIRHIYLDFDSGGSEALDALKARGDLPPPSYVIHSSPGKFQTLWNVRDFTPDTAKPLLHHLAYTLGADRAVHDLSRVLRLPGFRNYKYDPAPFVRLEYGPTLDPYPPASFPTPAPEIIQPAKRAPRSTAALPGTTKAISRSELDWARVRSALAAGAPWRTIWSELLSERQDKPNPPFYASLTILNALKSLSRPEPPELVAELRASKAPSRPAATHHK